MKTLFSLILILSALLHLAAARADEPPKPEVRNSTLRLVTAGQKTTLILYGENLAPKVIVGEKPLLARLLGAAATEGDFKARGSRQVTVEVTAPAACLPGSYDLILTQPDKTTVRLPVVVLSSLALRLEAKKAVTTPIPPMPLPAPSALVTGTVERDAYSGFSFEAKTDETWEITLYSGRIGSDLDALLRLRDRFHHSLALSAGLPKKDRRILFHAPAAGTYFLELSDADNRGGPAFTYGLTLRSTPPKR